MPELFLSSFVHVTELTVIHYLHYRSSKPLRQPLKTQAVTELFNKVEIAV